MTDIPEDVVEAVKRAEEAYDGNTSRMIAGAILAERERCATVTRAMLKFADTTSGADEAIPAAILDPDHWLARNPERAAGL